MLVAFQSEPLEGEQHCVMEECCLIQRYLVLRVLVFVIFMYGITLFEL